MCLLIRVDLKIKSKWKIMYKCEYCKRIYQRRSSLSQHRKKCIHKPTDINDITKLLESTRAKQEEQHKLIQQQQHQKAAEMLNNEKFLNAVRQIIREETNRLPQNITNNITNVIITKHLPDCFYQALVDKLGAVETNKFLNITAAENKPIEIYKKLYPSGIKSENPVIYENDNFKYLKDNQVVADNSIIKQIARKIQAAMLMASSSLINESIKINKTNQLYDIYDIGQIQKNLTDIECIEQQISDYIKVELIDSTPT